MKDLWPSVTVNRATDKSAATYVFRNDHEDLVEGSVDNSSELLTVTLSSQVGCKVGCRFCSAGLRFVRSLTAAEIVAQARRMIGDFGGALRPVLVTFMGIGEPMLNLKNLVLALEELHRLYPHARLYVSTSAPRIDYEPLMALAARVKQIDLQVSVHEPTDERRNKLIPFAAKMLLAEIGELGRQWHARTGRRPVMNYCVHEENADEKHVEILAACFQPGVWIAKVSVINASLSDVTSETYEQARKLAERFLLHLQSRGFAGLLFDQLGQRRVAGACGQFREFRDWVLASR